MIKLFDLNTNSAILQKPDKTSQDYNSSVVECWYTEHRKNLLLHVQAIVKDRAIAEELLHECFIKISKMPAVDRIQSPYAFLAKILTNLALDYLRKLGNEPEQENENVLLSIESNDEIQIDLINRSREIESLYVAINQLPARCREVLLLVKFREMTLKDTAVELGISQTMVEKHLQRALAKCKLSFSQNNQSEDEK